MLTNDRGPRESAARTPAREIAPREGRRAVPRSPVPEETHVVRSLAGSLARIRLNRWQFTSQVLVVAVVLAYVGSLVAVPRPLWSNLAIWDTWVRNATLVLPIVPIYLRARRYGELRGAWLIMGAGVALFDVATFIDLLPANVLQHFQVGTTKDVVYLISYVAVGAAFSLMAQRSFGAHANSVRLDGLIAALGFGALASLYWFKGTIQLSGRPLIAELNISNPILVMVLLVLLIAGLVPRRFHLDMATSMSVLAMGWFFVGDVLNLHNVAADSMAAAAVLRAAQPLGLCLLAWAAWPGVERRDGARQRAVSARGLNFLPVVFGVISIAVLGASLVRPTPRATSFMALGSLGLVIVRMILTQGEVRDLGRTNFDEARTDHVTGLANRRAFLEDGEQRLATLEEHQRLGIVLIDLDGFKEVNDSIGHAYGDELLKVVGQRFANRLGERGSVARIGGDEFAYTFVIEAGHDALASAHDLARSLANPVSLDGTKVRVSASIGVALHPEHGETHSALLRSADVAMYESKRSHTDVAVYRDDIDANSRQRLSLINDLRSAIERRRLTLHFQPTFDLRDDQVHGIEALVRWHHPTQGLLYPDGFIPLAERVGLIMPLTRTVLDLAISEMARLDRAGHTLQMNVNISQWDLMDERLPESIDRMLSWYDLPAKRLTLEVTESSLGEDPQRAKQGLERLRSNGIRVAIDDFGVGYSSLSQLLELPADELKIDKSFILAIRSDERAIALIRSTVEMAHALGLLVIAEGVEDAVSLAAVRAAGADIIQGDFIATPLASVQLDDYLATPASYDASDAASMLLWMKNGTTAVSGTVRPNDSATTIRSAAGLWSQHRRGS
jgi:diguanylate cyclase (GGDEF)-like protein